jgi:hypothetical protein
VLLKEFVCGVRKFRYQEIKHGWFHADWWRYAGQGDAAVQLFAHDSAFEIARSWRFRGALIRYNVTVPPRQCLSVPETDRHPKNQKGLVMKSNLMFASVLAIALSIPLVANAQGVTDGIQHGASVGSQTAGPVGAVVGGVVGGVIGGVEWVIGGVKGLFGFGAPDVAYAQPAPEPAPKVHHHHRPRQPRLVPNQNS